MKRTSPGILIGAAVLAFAIGFGLDQLLSANGRATIVPDILLPMLLAVVAIAVPAIAWPIRRAVRDPKLPRPNPFRALRTAVLARASSLLGAASAGFAGGLLVFALTRPVLPEVGSITVIGATVVTGILLVVGALVAESFCTLPKDNDDDSTGSNGLAANPL